MKRIFLFIVFLGFCISSVNAQVAWGVRAGLCYSTMTGEGGSVSGKPSLEIGPTMYYALKNNLYINTGLMFSMKNFEADVTYIESGKTYSETLNGTGYYLDVPIYLGYAFSTTKTTFYFQAGPFVGFKLAEGGDELGVESLNAGVGAAVGINIKRFKIELGYQQGLLDVTDGWDVLMGSAFAGISYVF